MASIREITNKDGNITFQVTVTEKRDRNGKQKRHCKTFSPPETWSYKRRRKAAEDFGRDYEREIEKGFDVNNKQTFAEYAEYVLALKESNKKKVRTIEFYRELLARINAAIGHKLLTEIRPTHLNAFYINLSEPGQRIGNAKATLKPSFDIVAALKEKGLSRNKLAGLSNVSPATITNVLQGKRVNKSVADSVSAALDLKIHKIFTIEENQEPLSTKTILEHHRLISTILKQAEDDMIVTYNAAKKAKPPEYIAPEAEIFQPDDVIAIRDALESENIKWKTLTHMLLITGCRRGEIAGLMWDRVDWDNSMIKIDKALLQSKTKGIYDDTTKTSTTRHIKLPYETMTLLKEYKQWYLELEEHNGDRWQNSGYVFVKDDGSCIRPDSITKWLSKFSKRRNLPHIHPHKFRHTMASLLYFNGIDSVAISKRLGHAKVSTTSDMYAHITNQSDERASESIADVILRTAT